MTTTLMETTTSPDAAAARLRLRGFKVREHGLRWIVKQDGSDEVLTLTPDDLVLASRLAQQQPDMAIEDLSIQLEITSSEMDAALTTRPVALTPTVMMDEAEAKQAIGFMRGDLEQVDVSLTSFRRRALDFKEREGWRALGYAGYLEAIQQELRTELSRSYISRLVQAAEVERDLDLPMGKSEEVPERQLRALGTLDKAEERREAWGRAHELAGDKPTTIKHVERAVEEQKAAPLPPAPDGWIIWQNDDGPIGLKHASGYKLVGDDAAALIREAESLGRYLTELHEREWRVTYDPMCPPNLHAYTATHEHLDAVAAHDVPHLAYLAWRADVFDDDLPSEWPEELIEALYHTSEDVLDLARQGYPLGRVYYLAGLEQPTTTTTTPAEAAAIPHLPPPAEWKAAKTRAAALGLRLDMAASGAFCFYRLSDGAAHGGAVDWPAALDLFSRKEVDRLRHLCEQAEALGATVNPTAYDDPLIVQVVPPKGHQQRPLKLDAVGLAEQIAAWGAPKSPPAKGRADWWNCGRERTAFDHALNSGDQLRAVRAAAQLTVAVAGDATRLALTQAEKAADVLEAEGYASVASLLRLLAPESEQATEL